MKTEKDIVMAIAKLIDDELRPAQAYGLIMDMANVEGIERNTREALLTLVDEIHGREW